MRLRPALVVYHSIPSRWQGMSAPMLTAGTGTNTRSVCLSRSDEYFGRKIVTKFFCPITNGQYHLGRYAGRDWTNLADIIVNLKK